MAHNGKCEALRDGAQVRVLFVSAADPVSEIESRLRPLWPCYLAGYAKKHLGQSAIEFRHMRGRLESELHRFKPHVVGISSVSQNFSRYAKGYASVAKRHGCKVLVGGMHITSVPGCLTSDMDVGCIGAGEETFLELMRLYIATGDLGAEGLAKVRGIVYRDGGRLVRTPGRATFPSLDELPHPDRSLIGYGNRAYLYTARGCAYQCVFCSCAKHWGRVRYCSPEHVLDELRELVDHGVRVVRFNDENFIADRKRFFAIAMKVVAEGIHRRARFSCWCRSNNVNREVAQALRAMNVVSVKMGLESGCDRTLAYLKGGVTVEDNRRAVDLLKDQGIQVNGDFIIGAPQETEDEIMQTYEFIKNSRLDFVDVNVLAPLPGTPVWEYALKRNLVTEDMDWERLNFKFGKRGQDAVVLSETLSQARLAKLLGRFQRLRAVKFLKAIRSSPWRTEMPLFISRKLREMLPHRVPGRN